MKLEHFETAIALQRHGTVNGTAAVLKVAPSSVSERVRQLESRLGVKLFSRSSAGMEATPAGRAYLDRAAGALAILEEAASQLRESAKLRVGAQASVADEIVYPLLERLAASGFDTPVTVYPNPDRQRLLRSLAADDLDAILLLDVGDRVGDLGFDTPSARLEYLDVRPVPLRVVVAPRHSLVGRPVSQSEVRRLGALLGREPRCSFWLATQRWLGSDAQITAAGGLARVREWVAKGRGAAILPDFAIREDVSNGSVECLDVEPPVLQLRLVWREASAAGPLAKLLYALSQG